MIDLVAGTLMTVGAILALTAGIGLQRFPDVLSRMHAATKPATLGLSLVLAGAALRIPDAGSVAKLLLVIVLQFVTAPTGAHLIGRAVYSTGSEPKDAA
ncbi:MAG: monovalent cation/H(+) antiporter subunit G [Nitriliruptorales bacterium]|nr:monovalent cation/H(+) antiporter subunit G [Nitriliruptorales bacterium]